MLPNNELKSFAPTGFHPVKVGNYLQDISIIMSKTLFSRPVREPYIYANLYWKILSFKKGTDFNLLDGMFDQLLISLTRYSKLLVVKFDIHLSNQADNNKGISNLFRTLKKSLFKAYSTEIGYCWVKEQTSMNKSPHYHCAVYFNGHKAKTSHIVFETIRQYCKNINISHHFPKNASYGVNHGDLKSIQRVLIRLSYLAKKEMKNKSHKNEAAYQTSRLKPDDNYKKSPFYI